MDAFSTHKLLVIKYLHRRNTSVFKREIFFNKHIE